MALIANNNTGPAEHTSSTFPNEGTLDDKTAMATRRIAAAIAERELFDFQWVRLAVRFFIVCVSLLAVTRKSSVITDRLLPTAHYSLVTESSRCRRECAR